MTSEVEDDDEDRWAQAESVLAGAPSAEAKNVTHRRRNQLLLIFGALVVGGVVAGLLTALLLPSHSPHRSSHPTGWSVAVGLVIVGCGLVIAGVAVVALFRRAYWRRAWFRPAHCSQLAAAAFAGPAGQGTTAGQSGATTAGPVPRRMA